VTPQPPISTLISVWNAHTFGAGQVLGIGIDLVEVEPLRQLIEAGGVSFIDTAWTKREQKDANGQIEGLAGKWAAKEAVMKSLQHGIGELDPRDVEVVTTLGGAPKVELHRAARVFAEKYRISEWHLSLTHEGGWAAAIAFASTHPYLDAIETRNTEDEWRNRD
jgi:holo-[acyl-carrier protein] synthase